MVKFGYIMANRWKSSIFGQNPSHIPYFYYIYQSHSHMPLAVLVPLLILLSCLLVPTWLVVSFLWFRFQESGQIQCFLDYRPPNHIELPSMSSNILNFHVFGRNSRIPISFLPKMDHISIHFPSIFPLFFAQKSGKSPGCRWPPRRSLWCQGHPLAAGPSRRGGKKGGMVGKIGRIWKIHENPLVLLILWLHVATGT